MLFSKIEIKLTYDIILELYNIIVRCLYMLQSNTSATIQSYNFSPSDRNFQDLFSSQLSNMHYNIIDDNCRAASYIPMTYLFYMLKFVSPDPSHSFHPTPIPLATIGLFSVSVSFICLFWFLYSTYK